jgi:hypothetical protein
MGSQTVGEAVAEEHADAASLSHVLLLLLNAPGVDPQAAMELQERVQPVSPWCHSSATVCLCLYAWCCIP